MKVCHLVLTDSPYGTFRVALNLAKAESKSIEVVLAANSDALRFMEGSKLTTIELPISLAAGWPSGLGWLRFRRQAASSARALEAAIAKMSVDVVHVHLPNSYAIASSYRGPAPVLITVHGVFYETLLTRTLARFLNPLVFRNTFKLTVVNKNLLGYASGSARVPADSVAYVPNGIDAEQIRSMAEAADQKGAVGGALGHKGQPEICFVGRLEKRKGPGLLLGAIRALRSQYSDLRCVIVGDGPLREHLMGEARRMGIQGSTIFVGFQRNPYQFMKASDLVVTNLSKELEGVSLVHYEAAALGKPVVTFFDPYKQEVFGDSMYFVREESESAVAKTLNDALHDVQMNRAKVPSFDEDSLSWDRIAGRYIELYRGLLSAP